MSYRNFLHQFLTTLFCFDLMVNIVPTTTVEDTEPPPNTVLEHASELLQRIFPQLFVIATLSYDEGDGDLFYKITNDRHEFLRLAKTIDPRAVPPTNDQIDFSVLSGYLTTIDGFYGTKQSLLNFFLERFPDLHNLFSRHPFPPGIYLLPGSYPHLFLWPGRFDLSPETSPLVTLVRILFELSSRTCLLLSEEECTGQNISRERRSRPRSRKFTTRMTQRTTDEFVKLQQSKEVSLHGIPDSTSLLLSGPKNRLFYITSSIAGDDFKYESFSLGYNCPYFFDSYRVDFSEADHQCLEFIATRFRNYKNSPLTPIFKEYHVARDLIAEKERCTLTNIVKEKELTEKKIRHLIYDELKSVEFSTDECKDCPVCLFGTPSFSFRCCGKAICHACKSKFERTRGDDCWFCQKSTLEFSRSQTPFEYKRTDPNGSVNYSYDSYYGSNNDNYYYRSHDVPISSDSASTSSTDPMETLKKKIIKDTVYDGLRKRRREAIEQVSKKKKSFNIIPTSWRSSANDNYSNISLNTMDNTEIIQVLGTELGLSVFCDKILKEKITTHVKTYVQNQPSSSALSIKNEEKQALDNLKSNLATFFDSRPNLPIVKVKGLTKGRYYGENNLLVVLPNHTKSIDYKAYSVATSSLKSDDPSVLINSFSRGQSNPVHKVNHLGYSVVNCFNVDDTVILVLSSQSSTDLVIRKKYSHKASIQTFPRRTYAASFCYKTHKLLMYSCERNNHTVGLFLVNPDQGKPQELRSFPISSRFSDQEVASGQPLLKQICLVQDGDKAVCLDLNGHLLVLLLKSQTFDHVVQRLPMETDLDSVWLTYIEQPQLLFLCYKSLSTNSWVAEGRLISTEGRKEKRVFDCIGVVELGPFISPSFHLLKESDHFLLVQYASSRLTTTPIKITTQSSSLELIYEDQNVDSSSTGSGTTAPCLKMLPRALAKFGMSDVSFESDRFIDEIEIQRCATVIAPVNQEQVKQVFDDMLTAVKSEGFLYEAPIIKVEPFYEQDNNLASFSLEVFLMRAIACVPLQIARFDGGTFLPLYDGHNAANWYENCVDGEGLTAQVIADNIRFGSLDLLFSYFSKKAVSVLTCAGEQSSGKSTFLNHFMGSFFDVAGSRTTVGVWSSVRVSSTRVWVALDLEGLSSYERSVQQDAYQSLFGAALAQSFVLRTGMLFGRFIEQLLKSWIQAASTLPDADDLFKSELFITPRDVPDSAVDEVTKEFTRHLESTFLASVSASSSGQKQAHTLSLFRTEDGECGASVLPFAPYAKFKHYMEDLKDFFDRCVEQTPRFSTCTKFRSTTALLLAKLFVQDFSSVSESALKQKLDTLTSNLVDAIAGGALGPKEQSVAYSAESWISTAKPLDVDNEVIPDESSLSITLPLHEDTLARLDPSCSVQRQKDTATITVSDFSDKGVLLSPPRQQGDSSTTSAHTFFTVLANFFTSKVVQQKTKFDVQLFDEFLHLILFRRQKRVFEFFNQTVGSDASNQTFQRMKRELQSKFDHLRLSYKLCKGNCKQTAHGQKSSCCLPCSLLANHEGECKCLGDHKCSKSCRFCPNVPCSLGADHAGDCVCAVTQHKCKGKCSLHKYAGCQHGCSLELEHSGDCFCAVPFTSHLCTSRCSLPKCSYQCKIPHSVQHERHDCQNSGCIEKCPLCNRQCASNDHFHSLHSSSHLCGHAHSCEKECSKPGNCEILTQLRQQESVYKTSAGDEINYQLFSEQNAQRKRCGTAIEVNETAHQGVCDCNVDSHYCDVRCASCGYFCSLAIGHEGPCFCTHGNMRNSKLVSLSDKVTVGQVGTFGRGDSGIALTCTNMCRQYGRGHIHLVLSDHPALIDVPVTAKKAQSGTYEKGKVYVEVTCAAYWQYILKFDPQFQADEVELFGKCSTICGADHENPSFCVLDLFHAPHSGPLPDGMISGYQCNGHVFPCTHSSSGTYHSFLIVDRSGSMSSTSSKPYQSWISQKNILGAAVEAMYNFQQKRAAQNPNDFISVIEFDSNATLLLDSLNITNDETFRSSINSLYPRGGTEFYYGIEVAVSNWRRNERSSHTPLFILLSDGGDGRSYASKMRDLLSQLVRDYPNAIVHTIGFGSGADRSWLSEIAQLGHGQYHHTEDSLSLSQAFVGLAKDPVRSSFV
ncbi:hypothetical protein RCL1_001953 [Eukaryota sp. TZLM3-RCL]